MTVTKFCQSGVVCHLMKQYERAEQLYSYALQLNPDLAIAKQNLIKLQKSQRKQTYQ